MGRGLILPKKPNLAGVDEAGRGPLAGPVVAAAVILPIGFKRLGINDSKQLTRQQREMQESRIKRQARWSVAFVGVDVIDQINILQATFEAMRRAVSMLAEPVDEVVVDGDKIPPGLEQVASCLVRGDGRHASIAAASVLAKCARDRYMMEMATAYPGYGFENHFGYATPEHFEAIERLGPCPLHRQSFSPFRKESQLCLALEV